MFKLQLAVARERIDRRLALQDVAFRQAGYFSTAQAKQLGFSAQAQKYHSDRGNWTRVDRGLYRLPGWPPDESDAYTRWYVWGDGGGVISHQSAAAVHNIGDLDPRDVHLTFAKAIRTRLPGVIVHEAELIDTEIVDVGSFRVTSPIRTALDLADAPITQEQFNEVVADGLSTYLFDRRELLRRADESSPTAALRIERAASAVGGGQ